MNIQFVNTKQMIKINNGAVHSKQVYDYIAFSSDTTKSKAYSSCGRKTHIIKNPLNQMRFRPCSHCQRTEVRTPVNILCAIKMWARWNWIDTNLYSPKCNGQSARYPTIDMRWWWTPETCWHRTQSMRVVIILRVLSKYLAYPFTGSLSTLVFCMNAFCV